MLEQSVNQGLPICAESASVRMPNYADPAPAPIYDKSTGFLHHPAGYPLYYEQIGTSNGCSEGLKRSRAGLGLAFESEEYISPGIILEIAIPLGGEKVRFQGDVILASHYNNGYKIGLWIQQIPEARRLRIVEQFCHIQIAIKQQDKDKTRESDSELLAAEWIRRHASSIPVL